MANLFRPPKDTRKRQDQSSHGQHANSTSIFAWEDAIDLYQGFEWQDSAQAFLQLAQSISEPRLKTQCSINAAIIYARSGFCQKAADVLDEISPPDAFLALTLFLMGHVQYELRDTDRAEQCFRIALDQLNHKSIKFDDLEFVLDPTQIKLNLAMMDKNMGSSSAKSSLVALPADGILRAASRPSLHDSAFLRNSKTLADRASTITAIKDSHTPAASSAQGFPASGTTEIESVEYSNGDLKHHKSEQQSSPNADASESSSFLSRRSIGSLVKRMSSYRRQSKPPRSNDAFYPPAMQHCAQYIGGFAQGGFDPEPDYNTGKLAGLKTYQSSSISRVAPRPLSFADLSYSPVRSLSVTDSPARSSASDSPPSLTDRESISDVSTHSDFGPASTDLIEVAVQSDAELVETHLAVPLPPKNPSRRIVAMERAQKILAERAQTVPGQSVQSPQIPPRSARQRTSSEQPRLALDTSALTAVTSRRAPEVADTEFLNPRAPPPVPKMRSQHARVAGVLQEAPLTALPPMPDTSHRPRPDATRRFSAFLAPMPSLRESVEPSN